MRQTFIRKIIRFFFNRWYKVKPPEMVSYWTKNTWARARVVSGKDRSLQMQIEGEKYNFPGFPRGHILTLSLAKLKHTVKNALFNGVWAMLETNTVKEIIAKNLQGEILEKILQEIRDCKHDMMPPEKMAPAIRELWRASTLVEERIPNPKEQEIFSQLKKGACFFFQEDDAYRFRLQWISKFIDSKKLHAPLLKEEFSRVLKMLEDAEIVSDMKGRSKLIERVLSFIIAGEDKFSKWFEAVCNELDWKKMELSPADKYYFRGKYFKVDHDKFDY